MGSILKFKSTPLRPSSTHKSWHFGNFFRFFCLLYRETPYMTFVQYLQDICEIFLCYLLKCSLCRNHFEVGCNGGATLDSGNVETVSPQLLRSHHRARAISFNIWSPSASWWPIKKIFLESIFSSESATYHQKRLYVCSPKASPQKKGYFFSAYMIYAYMITFKSLLKVSRSKRQKEGRQ